VSATKPDGSVVHTAYCGSSTLVTDEASHWRRSETDGTGRPIEVDEPNSPTATVNSNGCPGTGDPIWVTTYAYDALDDLGSVNQGGSRNRSFIFDSLKRLTSSTNPETGTITYAYDADGNVITKADTRPVTSTYSYDVLNRATGIAYSNGDPSVAYAYDQATCIGQSPCYNVGRRTSMTDAGGSESISYDKMGREWGEQRTTNNVTKTTGYTYDLDGDLATLTYPSGRTITYTYDSAGRPSLAQDLANNINYAFGTCGNGVGTNGVCYAPQGGVAQISNGSALVTTAIYNNRLQPCWSYSTTSSALATNTSCSANDPGPATILDLQYTFNGGSGNNGNVVGITNNRDSTRSQSFTYDQVNRIIAGQTSSTYATSPAHCWGESFSYDQWANLLSIGVVSTSYNGCTQDNLSVSATTANQLPSSVATYDPTGNMLTDGINTYAWNGEGELKTGTGVNYTYDGTGRRLEKSSGKIYWYVAGSDILDESDLSGNLTNEYVFFGGKRIAMRNVSTGTIYYYTEDMLGSSRTIVQDGQTSPCYDADFTPFGTEHAYSNSCPQNYKFEGKERDTETNDDDFGARYYSFRFGRWVSADWSDDPSPIPYANTANPQTLNLYSMVSDNPETFADLDGHFWSPSDWFTDLAKKKKSSDPNNAYPPKPAYDPSILQRAVGAVKLLFKSGDSSGPGSVPDRGPGPPNVKRSWFRDAFIVVAMAQFVIPAEVTLHLGDKAVMLPIAASSIADHIGGGHAYQKHVVDRNEYPGMSQAQFKALIRDTIENPSDFKKFSGNKLAYWNDAEQTVVIVDPNNPDGGTAFRPAAGKQYFDELGK